MHGLAGLPGMLRCMDGRCSLAGRSSFEVCSSTFIWGSETLVTTRVAYLIIAHCMQQIALYSTARQASLVSLDGSLSAQSSSHNCVLN